MKIPQELALVLIGLLITAITSRFLISVWQRKDMKQSYKVSWTVFFLIAPLISIAFYLLFGLGRTFK